MRHVKLKLKGKTSLFVFALILLLACSDSRVNPTEKQEVIDPTKNVLPIIGQKDIDDDGNEIDHTISEFAFINQFGDTITQEYYSNKIYIADFIFTRCPGICPAMTNQMKRVQDSIVSLKDVFILSHTVDPEYDSTGVLLAYGKEKGADFSKWNFVTGTAYSIYKIATDYLVVAKKDTSEEVPFVHSEKFLLIDKKRRIRGMYDGTDSIEVNRLLKDIKVLVRE